jgi:hypothetical protein
MLDFYYSTDDFVAEYPIEENLAAGFLLEDFKALSKLWSFAKAKEIYIAFFDNYILTTPEIITLNQELSKLLLEYKNPQRLKGTAFGTLKVIFDEAIKKKMNLVAYCD